MLDIAYMESAWRVRGECKPCRKVRISDTGIALMVQIVEIKNGFKYADPIRSGVEIRV